MSKVPYQKIFAVIFLLLAFAWIWLFFSGKGFLVGSEERQGTIANSLECTYFTGTGFETKTILKTDIDALGSLVCPRMTDLD